MRYRALSTTMIAAWVVVADLTDTNPNVYYELGVRHALTDRTIIIAQKREHILFDLSNYANHVYDWKTQEGKAEFTQKLRELLADVDSKPDRPDNPVSDFLGRPRSARIGTGAVEELDGRVSALEEQMTVVMRLASSITPGGASPGTARLGELEPQIAGLSLMDDAPTGITWPDIVRLIRSAD